MKRTFLILMFPILSFADAPASTAALSTLQQQITQLQQQVQSSQQAVETANQNMQGVSGQLAALQKQVDQYGNATLSQFKWVDVANQVPANAYVAAQSNGSPLYICQANYSNGSGYYGGGNAVIDPGVVTNKGCVITYSGQAYLIPQYSVLTSNTPGFWVSGELIKTNTTQPPVYPLYLARVKGSNGSSMTEDSVAASSNNNEPIPLYNALAIIGGQENANNVYICRVQINGQYFIGKAANNTCYVAAGKYEASWPVFEVLLTRKP